MPEQNADSVPDYVSVIRRLLDGDVPQSGKWYGTDEDGCAFGTGHPITAAELLALDAALPDPDDRVHGEQNDGSDAG